MPSLKARFLAFFLRLTAKKSFATVEGLHRRLGEARKTQDHRPPEKIRERLTISEHMVDGHVVYEAQPKSGASGKRLLYLHGGAHLFEITPYHWGLIAELAERLGSQVTVPIYPLGPEHTFPKNYDMATQVYRSVLAEAPDASIVGDSAGGNMAAVLCMMAAENGWPLPNSLVLLSPGIDMSASGPDVEAYAKRDPWLALPGIKEAVRLYAPEMEPTDWRISPINGDLSVLPPTLAFCGTEELLYPIMSKFLAKARAAGVPIEMVVGQGMFHVWPLVDLPESKAPRDRMVAFLAASDPASNLERG